MGKQGDAAADKEITLEKMRLVVCASRGGWHRRTATELVTFWRGCSEAERVAMVEAVEKLKPEARQALEAKLAKVPLSSQEPKPAK